MVEVALLGFRASGLGFPEGALKSSRRTGPDLAGVRGVEAKSSEISALGLRVAHSRALSPKL